MFLYQLVYSINACGRSFATVSLAVLKSKIEAHKCTCILFMTYGGGLHAESPIFSFWPADAIQGMKHVPTHLNLEVYKKVTLEQRPNLPPAMR